MGGRTYRDDELVHPIFDEWMLDEDPRAVSELAMSACRVDAALIAARGQRQRGAAEKQAMLGLERRSVVFCPG